MQGKKEIIALILIFTFLGLIYSYPLIDYFFRGIPYTHLPDKGYELGIVKPEDNLLTFYWFWLLKDNLFGKSRIFSNPYEFNSIQGRENYGFYMFPFSLFFVLFSFLGNIAAYNSVVILSFVLAGMAMYYLCKFYTSDWKSSLIAGIIFSIAPFRLAQVLAGHLNGFLFFLIPLYFLLLELLILKKKLIFSIGAGLVLLSLAAMEFHLLYYVLLFTALFILFKIFRLKESPGIEKKENENSGVYKTIDYWAGVSLVLLSGMGFGLFVSLVNIRSGSYALGFYEVAFSCVLYAAILFFIWFLYSRFFSRFTKVSMPNAQIIDSWTYSPLMILFLYPVQYRLDLPFLGKALFLLSIICVLIAKISNLKKYSNQRVISFSIEISSIYKEIKSFLYPLVFLIPWIVLSAGYVFYLKKLFMDKSFTATGGRPYSLIMRNSPRISDIFFFQNPNAETLICPGIITVILSLIGIVVIINKMNGRTEVSLRNILFYGGTAFFAFILSLGPSLDGIFPLYNYLYKYLPYFNYPRVPGRLAVMTFLGLSILTGVGSKIIIEKINIGKKIFVYPLIIFLILLNYPLYSAGISQGDENNKIYKRLQKEIKDELLLEIPIFPGDTHYTSVYQYYVTTAQVKMVNGYNPLVSRNYVRDVFLGLENLNLGELREKEYSILKKLNAKFILVHENIYPPKVSPFPGLFSVKNMMDSPYLRLVDSDGLFNLFEIKKDSQLSENPEQKFNKTSAVSAFYESEEMPRNTGELFEEKEASGGYSVYGSPERHNMGTLVFGPYQKLPTGEYRVAFRLKAGKGDSDSEACIIDIATREGKNILSSKTILKKDFSMDRIYQDFTLNFALNEPERVEFRVKFLKKVEIWSDYVIVSFPEYARLRDYYEIEEFKLAIGKRKEDKDASGGWAVAGEAGEESAPYLLFGYGPYSRMDPGEYIIKFRLKITEDLSKEKEVAILYLGTNKGQKILAERIVKGDEFEKIGSYQDFKFNYKCEIPVVIDFSLYFKNNATLWVDRIDIVRMP